MASKQPIYDRDGKPLNRAARKELSYQSFAQMTKAKHGFIELTDEEKRLNPSVNSIMIRFSPKRKYRLRRLAQLASSNLTPTYSKSLDWKARLEQAGRAG